MEIIKHKSINLSVPEIMEAISTGKLPSGVGINITDDMIIVEPLNSSRMNILGIIDDDYERIFHIDDTK